jgi:hypothetical protein
LSSEANFSFTIKLNGDLLTVRGDTATDFKNNLDAFLFNNDLFDRATQMQAVAVTYRDGAGQLAAAEQALSNTFQTTPAPATATAATPAPAVAAPAPSQGTFEQVPGRYPGQLFTYNAPGAPSSINGTMVMKEWTAKSGKQMKAWVDPLDGPKPARAVGPKAELQWVN